MQKILEQLGLTAVNDGTWLGGQALSNESAPMIDSINPTNNEVIASVRQTTPEEYEQVLTAAREAFVAWRMVPAPVRGEAVRRIAGALRKYKDPLGSLVSLEMGKIKAEGDGEVQEMIDIADFAVGQSRMMYGKTMHSERPQHRMYEQWHPLGRRVFVECVHRRRVWQREHLEAVAENAADGRRSAKDHRRGSGWHGIADGIFPD